MGEVFEKAFLTWEAKCLIAMKNFKHKAKVNMNHEEANDDIPLIS